MTPNSLGVSARREQPPGSPGYMGDTDNALRASAGFGHTHPGQGRVASNASGEHDPYIPGGITNLDNNAIARKFIGNSTSEFPVACDGSRLGT